MSEFKIKEIVVYRKGIFGSFINREEYDDDKLSDVISWLQDQLDAVPAEYRDACHLGIESIGGYEGEHHVEMSIYYWRPESFEEKSEREMRYMQQAERYEAQERALFNSLKSKYEKP